MASIILSLDKQIYTSNESAKAYLEDSGVNIDKDYKFANTFKVDVELNKVDNLEGIISWSKEETELETSLHFDTNHLLYLSNDFGESTVAYNPKSTGSNQIVYLVDTGVKKDHIELAESDVEDFYTCYSDYADNLGHGTAMASLINGSQLGVSPNTKIKNIKILDSESDNITVGKILDTLDAILEDHVANDSSKVKVVCLAWTISKNLLVDEKISELQDENLLVICAAGNNGLNADDYSPAGLDSTFTVGSHDKDFTVRGSNVGHEIDVFGLGEDVSVAVLDVEGYNTRSGTSVATALVSGLAVQYIDLYPTSSARIIKSFISNEGKRSGRGTELKFAKSLLEQNNMNVYDLKSSIAVSPQKSEIQLADNPSGIILEAQLGKVYNDSIGLNENATDVSVLAFSPTPPWLNFDVDSGEFTVDLTGDYSSIDTGIYHFAIKGTVQGTTIVEEYSVGVYSSNTNELEDASEFYYDDESGSYEEIVNIVTSAKF
tara:strand:+ start:11000 stop:12469 length:1470 start_codon:yes stop_codon:yes gene_type:complete